MNDVQLFTHKDFGELRVVKEGDDYPPQFVAKDVCDALGINNPRQALTRLDADEKGVISSDTPGGVQKLLTINEYGLYSLVLSSRKPEAKAFKRWVTHEVLPSIRKTGGYMAAVPDETPEQTMARALLIAKDAMERKDEVIAQLRPKALLAEAVVEPTPICYTVSECARYLANLDPTIKRQHVFDELRSRRLMCKGTTAPTRRGIDLGRMVAVASEYVVPGTGEVRAGRQRGLVTAKGLAFLVECLVDKEVA